MNFNCVVVGGGFAGATMQSRLTDGPELYGPEHLRIADVTVMRNVVSGHSNAPSVMISETCADLMSGIFAAQSGYVSRGDGMNVL